MPDFISPSPWTLDLDLDCDKFDFIYTSTDFDSFSVKSFFKSQQRILANVPSEHAKLFSILFFVKCGPCCFYRRLVR